MPTRRHATSRAARSATSSLAAEGDIAPRLPTQHHAETRPVSAATAQGGHGVGPAAAVRSPASHRCSTSRVRDNPAP
jgi:hypothetical protein